MMTGGLVIAGLMGVCVGTYGVLDGSGTSIMSLVLLVAGCAVAAGGFAVGGRRSRPTAYRPDPWLGAEWMVVASGIASVVFMVSVTFSSVKKLL